MTFNPTTNRFELTLDETADCLLAAEDAEQYHLAKIDNSLIPSDHIRAAKYRRKLRIKLSQVFWGWGGKSSGKA